MAATTRRSAMGNGLGYFGARYFSGAQGRFTSPDKPLIGQDAADPQSWNLYTYLITTYALTTGTAARTAGT